MARKRLPGARGRATRMATKRAGRDFGRRLLGRLGFSMGDFKAGGVVRKKLGIFGESFSSGAAGPGPAPAIEQPERVSNESSPSLTTIVNQLNTLVKTANKVGILTKGQQEALLGQLAESRRISKEQLLEGRSSAPIPEPLETGDSNSLAPLGDVIDELKKQIDKLTNTVQEKVDDQEGETPNRGFLERLADRNDVGDDYRRGRSRRQVRANRVSPNQLLDRNGNPLRGAARTSRITKIAADKAASTRGGVFGRMFGRGTVAVAPAATVASTNIARSIGRGATRNSTLARAGGTSIAAAIKKAAGPIIARGLGSTALKSIPILGAVAGVGFAVNRLIKGDVVGAGLDLASGLGGPLTAIPALIAATARDVYSSVFGVQPEADPEVGSRMAMVSSVIEGLVKSQISQYVQPRNRPTQARAAEAVVPAERPQPPQRETAAPLGTAPTPPPAITPTTGGGSSTLAGSLQQFETSAPTRAPAAPVPSSADSVTRVDSSIQNSGADVIQASQQSPPPVIPNMYGFNQQLGRFTPQTTPTTKSGHAGIGNVPNPDYVPTGSNNLAAIFNVMFFNLNYQEL